MLVGSVLRHQRAQGSDVPRIFSFRSEPASLCMEQTCLTVAVGFLPVIQAVVFASGSESARRLQCPDPGDSHCFGFHGTTSRQVLAGQRNP